MSKHLNPLVYIALLAAGVFLSIGLGWAIGWGIACALLVLVTVAVDVGNGIITAIAGNRT